MLAYTRARRTPGDTTGLLLVSGAARKLSLHQDWRSLHTFSFAAFVLATAHGALAGTDSGAPWMRVVYVTSGALVALLALARLLSRSATIPAVAGPRSPAAEGVK